MALPDRVNSMLSGGEEAKADNSGDPLYNEVGVVASSREGEPRGLDVGPHGLFKRVKKSPEVLAIMSTLVDDIIGYGIDVEYVGRKDTPGTRKIEDARGFIEGGFKQELEAALMDMLIMGDGYLYKRKITEEDVKAFLDEYVDAKYEFNDEERRRKSLEYLSTKAFKQVDEDYLQAKGVQMVPASSMEHIIDKHGNITQFIQEVGQEDQRFPPNKIIHFPLMRLDGKTYGFSPLRSVVSEIDILANIKDTHGVFFDNAAVPNKIFQLPESGPNDANYKLLKETVKKYRRMRDKHKDLVLTGDVEIEDLNTLDKEMEFRELAEYITRVLVMAWGVPPTRIGIDISGGGSPSRTASLTNEGYFKRISRFQDKIATILNSQLFMPEFDVKIDFKNPDIRTEIKKADKDLRKTEVAKQRLALGLWDKRRALEYLGINPHESQDLEESELIELAQSSVSSQNNLLSDQDADEDTVSEGDASEKEAAASE